MKIGIAGFGTVGRALARFFARSGEHEVSVYDKYLEPFRSQRSLDLINAGDLAFVAVPTPFDPRAGACDVSEVYDAIARITVPVCIKSTVPPGTTGAVARATGKRVAFSPEYLGESAGHPWQDADACGFAIVAGDPIACALVRAAYESVSPGLRCVETDAATAELAKYMENCFLATKVAFANQFAELARRAGADFEAVRALFVLDPRVGESHTRVSAEGGFGGRCLPKDIASIVAWAGGGDNAPLLQAVIDYNDALRAERV
jgi:UDPglucose 6-dehydrogenase